MKPHTLQNRLIDNAVIGIVDIASSTAVCNAIDLASSFQLKDSFHGAAHKRAREFGVQILNDTGDGFLFLANPEGDDEWAANAVLFYETLREDFQNILAEIRRGTGKPLRSGLRAGVALGPVMIGAGSRERANLTVAGPVVNLAARLAARAELEEIVFSSEAWERIQVSVAAGNSHSCTYSDLKGFEVEIFAVHATGFSKRNTGPQMSVAM